MTPRARVGISGWRYASWRGDFYPTGLRQADELSYAAERMSAIELNGSFYSLQRPTSWQRWRDAVPDDVEIAVKGPRFLTHFRRLRDTRAGMANFLASGVLALGPKLGPLVWQTPADLPFEPEVIEPFLAALPRSTSAALDLARGRDDRMSGREHLEIDADFAYARLHGDLATHPDGYGPAGVAPWADWIRARLAEGRDAFVYCVTENKQHSPGDAEALLAALRAG